MRLAFSAGRGRGARVDARLLDELRNRRDPSPGACAIGAEVARAIVRGAAEQRAHECGEVEDLGGRDAQSRQMSACAVTESMNDNLTLHRSAAAF
jgi:hypothetical protein